MNALRALLATLALAVMTGLGTWLFLGTSEPPFALVLIIGLTVLLLALTITATFFVHPLIVAPVVALSFTSGWGAAVQDDSGLWPIGAVLALIGSLVGAGVVSTLTSVVRRTR